MLKRILQAGVSAVAVVSLWASTAEVWTGFPQETEIAKAAARIIPSGQKFVLRLETAIHTNSTRKGDRIEFNTAGDIYAENQVAIPGQSTVRATVTKAKRAGRLMGRAEIVLRLDEVRMPEGTVFPLQATIIRVGLDPVDAKGGPPSIKGDTGGGGNAGAVAKAGAQGAIIGVMVAGAKGAMYGGAVAAGISLGGMLFKRGPDLDLPRDTLFEARFDKALAVPEAVAQRIEQKEAQKRAAAAQAEEASANGNSERTRPVLKKPVLHTPEPTQKSSGETTEGTLPSRETRPVPEPRIEEAKNPPVPADAVPPAEPPAKPSEPVAADSGTGMYKLSVQVKMVLVDTVVRDRGGRMMENLKREDFRVFEDGAEQELQSLSRDELPLAVALVIDRSGSVAPYIHELRRIATDALEQLKPNDQVALFTFAGTVNRLVDLTTDRRQIAYGLDRIQTGGGTNIIDALFDSTTYLSRVAPDHRRAVILISDNQATVQPRTSEGETIRMAMETETVIYSIKTGGETIPLTMRLPNLLSGSGSVSKVTRETGGEILDSGKVGMLNSALSMVISRLRLRYVVGYYPANQERGSAFHSIEVRLADRFGRLGSDYSIHARRGYYSTGENAPSRSRP